MDNLPQHLRWQIAALLYALAYLAGICVFAWMAKRRNISTSGIWLLMQAGLLGGLVGANVFQFLVTGTLGKTVEGGFLGGYLAVIFMKRRLGILRPIGDLFALAFSAGEAIGRLGCLVGGCCYGKIATTGLLIHDHGALRYATPLYQSAAAAATFALLVWLERKMTLPENTLFYLQGLFFCLERFVIEFYRSDSPGIASLTFAQIGCIFGAIFFFYKLAERLVAPLRVTSL